MIPDHKDKLTKEILKDSIPEWNNPGFTDLVMSRIIAVEKNKASRRRLLIPGAVIAAVVLIVYAFVNLLRTKPTAFSTQVHAFEQVGAWISGKEYILLPLVLLLLAKRIIDSHHARSYEAR